MLINRVAVKNLNTYTGSIASAFYKMMNEFHSLGGYWDNYDIESLLLQEQQANVEGIKNRVPKRTDIVVFNPSSAGKCPRELFYKNSTVTEEGLSLFPYNVRWAANGTAVHSRIQRDLLYAEKLLNNNPFKVAKAVDVIGDMCQKGRENFPAWESNLLITKEFEHNGVHFGIRGMADGFLWYKDKLVNLEIKTKSTTIAAIGTYKMKEPMHHHVMQCICYSLLFKGDPYEDRNDTSILFYESLAKDGWTKGADARSDIRTFQIDVTKEDRIKLLDKFAYVTECIQTGEIPNANTTECLFCGYKSECGGE